MLLVEEKITRKFPYIYFTNFEFLNYYLFTFIYLISSSYIDFNFSIKIINSYRIQ